MIVLNDRHTLKRKYESMQCCVIGTRRQEKIG